MIFCSSVEGCEQWGLSLVHLPRLPQYIASCCRWAVYIGFLPKSCPGLPLFWAAEDLQRLMGSSALDKMAGRGCSYAHSLEQPSEAGPHSSPHMHPHVRPCMPHVLREGDNAIMGHNLSRVKSQHTVHMPLST